MKKYLLVLSFAFTACFKYCPSNELETIFQMRMTTKKDSIYFKNIKRIYALGASGNNYKFPDNNRELTNPTEIYLTLPIAYGSKSTTYVIENRKFKNDTIEVFYNSRFDYKDSECGYSQLITGVFYKSTLSKYEATVNFEGYNGSACNIRLTEKK